MGALKCFQPWNPGLSADSWERQVSLLGYLLPLPKQQTFELQDGRGGEAEPDEEIECESRLNPGGNVCTCYWDAIYCGLTAGVISSQAELGVGPLEVQTSLLR